MNRRGCLPGLDGARRVTDFWIREEREIKDEWGREGQEWWRGSGARRGCREGQETRGEEGEGRREESRLREEGSRIKGRREGSAGRRERIRSRMRKRSREGSSAREGGRGIR